MRASWGLLVGAMAVAPVAIWACSKASATSPDAGATSPDGAVGSDVGTGGDASPGSDVGAAGDAGPDVSVTLAASIPVGNQIQAMASNGTTNRLYVSMVTLPGAEAGANEAAGIAVIDETTNTVVTTIAAPIDLGKPQTIGQLAVDETANVVYAAQLNAAGDGPWIWIIDGATNTISASALTVPSTAVSLAVDAAGRRLYAATYSSNDSMGNPVPTGVTVFDTSMSPPVSIATVPLADLDDGSELLALDPTNHVLFACGASLDGNQDTSVDTVDTMTNAISAAQVTFSAQTDGYLVDCKGGAGYANVLTNGTTSSPPVLDELEPARLPLGGTGFVPDSYTSRTENTPGGHQVFVAGHDSVTGQIEYFVVEVVHEKVTWGPIPLIGNFKEKVLSDRIYYSTAAEPTAVGEATVTVYVAVVAADDAGGDSPVPTVFVLHFNF